MVKGNIMETHYSVLRIIQFTLQNMNVTNKSLLINAKLAHYSIILQRNASSNFIVFNWKPDCSIIYNVL